MTTGYITDPLTGELVAIGGGPSLETVLAATDAEYPKKNEVVAKGEFFLNIQDVAYAGGAPLNGVSDDGPAISAAIAAASAAGGGRVYGPIGRTASVATPIDLRDNVILDLPMKFKPLAGLASSGAAFFRGTSGNTASNVVIDNPLMTIDGEYGTSAMNLKGILVTNGSRIQLRNFAIKNMGDAGVVLQGLGSGGGTPDSVVEGLYIDGTGLADGTTGYGIVAKDASSFARIEGNTLKNIKGGMGIALDGLAGTGFPLHCAINDNTITMAPSNTGFEGIGIVAGCDYATVNDNNIYNSQDNGISISNASTTCTGNNIDGALNHGIASGGTGNVITGNFIRNVGQQRLTDGLEYGGVCITAATNNVVGDNRIVDDQSTKTMVFGVKEVTTAGGHQYFNNRITGAITRSYSLLSNTSSYVFVHGVTTQTYSSTMTPDATSSAQKRITATDGNAFTIANPIGQFPGAVLTLDIVNGTAGALGALTWGSLYKLEGPFVLPLPSARRSISFYYDGTNWVETHGGSGVATNLVSDDATKGIVFKSPDGHWWRQTISNAGAVVTTDLGTTRPAS